jgi:hypothetical protein
MAASSIIFIAVAAAILLAGAIALGPWVAGIALLLALAVWVVVAMLGAAAGRRADEEGISEPAAAQREREPTPPAEPSH